MRYSPGVISHPMYGSILMYDKYIWGALIERLRIRKNYYGLDSHAPLRIFGETPLGCNPAIGNRVGHLVYVIHQTQHSGRLAAIH